MASKLYTKAYRVRFSDGNGILLNKNLVRSSSVKAVSYLVKEGDTLESISVGVYGDPAYYYIIAEANDILDPFFGVKPGQILTLPELL